MKTILNKLDSVNFKIFIHEAIISHFYSFDKCQLEINYV